MVPSDDSGTRRFQEVISIEPGRRYRGAVHYLFRGGCVTYRLDFRGDDQARPLADVTEMLAFADRESLREDLRRTSKGRLELDPSS
jgi:hypothetical protein